MVLELPSLNRKLSEVRRRKSGQSQKIDRLTLDNFIARNCGWFSLRYGESNFSFPLWKSKNACVSTEKTSFVFSKSHLYGKI